MQETLHANKNPPPRLQSESKKKHTKLNLENKRAMPDFSYAQLEIREPTRRIPSTRINVSLTDLPKEKRATMT